MQHLELDVVDAFLLRNLCVLGRDVFVELAPVQLVEVGVFVDHALDEFDEVVVVTERSFHLRVGGLLLEVFAQFLAFASELEHVVAHEVDHLWVFLEFGVRIGVPDLSLDTDLVVQVVEFLESVDFELHFSQL